MSSSKSKKRSLYKELKEGFVALKKQRVYTCKRCNKKLNPKTMTFGAGGYWCSDYCAEKYLYERGML